VFLAERVEKELAGFVIANYADRNHVHPKVGQIVDCVACPSGDDGALTMAHDQHWRLARNTGYLAVNKFVGNQVTQHNDAELRERLNDPDERIGRFGAFLHAAAIFSRSG
jgi:hypothetical protein